MSLRFTAWALTLAPLMAACGETFVTGGGGGGQGMMSDGDGTDGQPSGGSTSDDAGTGGNGSTLCGNSSIDPGEECDDGNTERGDSCDAKCLVEVSLLCGNGELNPLVLEQCDDGNANSGDGCSVRCQIEPPEECGDGELRFDQGEECDDENQVSGDGCSSSCQLEGLGLFCGDDTLQQNEKCDDGNSGNGDGCNPTCTLTGKVSTVAGSAGVSGNIDGTGENARFGFLSGIAVSSRYVYFGDTVDMATTYLKRYDPETNLVKTLLMVNGGIEAIATDGGTRIWIAGGANPSIQEIEDQESPKAELVAGGKAACTMTSCFKDGDGLDEATFGGLRGLAWYDGLLYLVDPNAAVLRTFDPETKEVETVAGSPFATSTTPVDGVGAEARFESPRYLASNNSGILFISDTNGAAIRSFNVATGAVGTFAGNGMEEYSDGKGDSVRVHRPRGITTDASSLYFVEADMHTVRQGIFASSAVSTLAGFIDTPGAGDGTGINARFKGPTGVVYHQGEKALFVLDSDNHLIRRID